MSEYKNLYGEYEHTRRVCVVVAPDTIFYPMKIIFCLNCDIHAATALNLLLPHLKNHQIRLTLSDGVGKANDLPQEILALKDFERNSLLRAFEKIESGKSESSIHKFKTFKQIAQSFNSEIFSYNNINSNAAIADFKRFAPDLVISIRFGHIFKNDIIKIPKKGILNLHSGILPDFRGIMSTFWAVLNQESKLGSTLHYITNSQIDAGDVIKINYFDLDKERSLVFNINKLYYASFAAIIDAITKIENGIAIESFKQKGEGNYFSYPKQKEVEQFLKIMPLYTEKDGAELLNKWI